MCLESQASLQEGLEEEDRGQGKKGKNVNPPPPSMKKSLFTGPAPLLLSNEMVPSGVAKCCYKTGVCVYVCVHRGYMDRLGDPPQSWH